MGSQKHKQDRKRRRIRIAAVVLAVIVIFGAAAGFLYMRRTQTANGDSPRIVCIGDSLTYGSGVRETRDVDAWPAVLERKLDGKYEVLNYGIRGATIQKAGDWPYDPKIWRSAKKQDGEIYILMLGSNDSKPQNWNAERCAREFRKRVRELKRIPSVERVYLMVPPPVYKLNETDEYAIYNIDGDVIRGELRDIIRTCAEENDVGLIDLYTLMEGHPEYMVDGAHPGKEGNELMAEHIAQVLRGEIQD